jgi:diphthamide synthase (EF-2-diphthine--ammonia ligase)
MSFSNGNWTRWQASPEWAGCHLRNAFRNKIEKETCEEGMEQSGVDEVISGNLKSIYQNSRIYNVVRASSLLFQDKFLLIS